MIVTWKTFLLKVRTSALQAEKRKLSHYENLSASGFIVMPIAAETMGSWAPMAIKFIKEIGSRLA